MSDSHNPESDLSREQIAEISEALFSNQKILAIKLYRDATGSMLLEAKQFIDRLEAELRKTHPESFHTPKSSGCLGLFLILTALPAGGWWLLG